MTATATPAAAPAAAARRGTAGSTDPRLAAQAWESLFRAQVALMRRFSAEDIWGPVSVKEYDVLFTLSRGPAEGLRLNELNKDVLLSQPSLSRMVDRLEAQGLVSRCTTAADRRGTLVALTSAGRELQKDIGRRHVRSIRRLVEPALDEDELRTLLDLTTRLRLAQDTIPDL